MIRDYQAIQKTWFAKGQQRIIPTYGKHEGVKLVGFLNYETGEVYVEEHQKYDAGGKDLFGIPKDQVPRAAQTDFKTEYDVCGGKSVLG